jgi:hypothetical protein
MLGLLLILISKSWGGGGGGGCWPLVLWCCVCMYVSLRLLELAHPKLILLLLLLLEI